MKKKYILSHKVKLSRKWIRVEACCSILLFEYSQLFHLSFDSITYSCQSPINKKDTLAVSPSSGCDLGYLLLLLHIILIMNIKGMLLLLLILLILYIKGIDACHQNLICVEVLRSYHFQILCYGGHVHAQCFYYNILTQTQLLSY
jgi:hypothetical protein